MAVDVAIERTPTELLIEAREFIADPSRWCQGTMWRDTSPPSGDMLRATQCCGIGSVERVARLHGLHGLSAAWLGATSLLDRTATGLYPESGGRHGMTPTAWVNDKLGHAAVLRVYDAAIAASQEA